VILVSVSLLPYLTPVFKENVFIGEWGYKIVKEEKI
jgi:hypothetical protein